MTQPRRGLGRGLDALFGSHPGAPDGAPADLPEEAPRTPPVPAQGAPDQLDIDLIAPNPEQPRTHFDPERLRELADSIREHGILQPVIISRDESGGYRLIAGERRLQAARLAGLQTVPVVIRENSTASLLELALIENIQRADLNPIEEATAYRRLTEDYGLTQEEAARRVARSRVAVANALRLLQLEPEIRRSVASGEITEGHGRALLGLPEGRSRISAWREVVDRQLSVREAEALVRRVVASTERGTDGDAPRPARLRRDSGFGEIEARLRQKLSTRVTVTSARRGARIAIECYSREEFDSVVQQLLGDQL